MKNKKWLKVIMLVCLVVFLAGCEANIDPKTGEIIAGKEITSATPWTLGAGWFDFFFVMPIAKLILLLTDVSGNAAIGVILTTVVINIITLPIMIKSTVSNQKMQFVQPEIEKIQRKYRGREDQASKIRMSNEINAIYKKYGISMWSSFVTFLTFPVMIAMYNAVQRMPIIYDTTFLGMNMGVKVWDMVTSFEIAYIVLLIVVAITQFISMEVPNILLKRKPRYRESEQMKSMRMTNYIMIVMFIYFSCIMPTAMSIYWVTNSIVMTIRSIFIDMKYGDTMTQKATYLDK